MNLNRFFGWLDYLIYLAQSTNRHGVHSPFVYDFADNVLYRKTPNAYESAAELCRKRMLQSEAKIQHQPAHAPKPISELAFKRIPLAKYYRLLFRWIQYKQLGGNIIEIGSSFGVLPIYLQRGNVKYNDEWVHRFFSYDRSEKIVEITRFNLSHYECNETVVVHPYSSISQIISHFTHHSLANSPIGLIVVNDETLGDEDFWQLMDFAAKNLEPNGCIVIFNLNQTVQSRLRWKQIENDENFQVTIDLFGMGLIFVRKEQIKEAFLLRY